MTEIELKARVKDRKALIKRLNECAHYTGSLERNDTYWGKIGTEHKKIRIRKEIQYKKEGEAQTETIFLTYKRKEMQGQTEVNDEKECLISEAAPLEAFLKDNGFSIMLQKKKFVKAWTYPLPKALLPPFYTELSATFELCTVPPLGDFLEIEILSPTDAQETVAPLQKALTTLLQTAGLSEEDKEMRYYSDLLSEQ